jgi:hypothetical protein
VVNDALPDVLTHYYRDRPFHSLSDLEDEAIAGVLEEIAGRRELEFRLTREEYLPRRRQIESEMRAQFVELGGRPVRESPHYAILGTFSLYEDDPGWRSVSAPLNAVASDVTFTFTDSFFVFSERNLRGVAIPPRPYYGRVYRLDDLDELVRAFGLPGERWRHEADRRFDVYVEAQIWDDAPLAAFR